MKKLENKPLPPKMAYWAKTDDASQSLLIESGARPVKMCHSDGTGQPLFSYNGFGADIIRFAAHEGVKNHTHEGDHILFVIKGHGFVEYNGIEYAMQPGLCYLIEGEIDHAIKATTDLVLIVVGNNHHPLDSEKRLIPIESK